MTRAPQGFFERVSKLFTVDGGIAAPGAVVSVREDGREIFAGCFGFANLNHDIPLARDSIIRIGSQTKQFTVLLLLMLEAEGRLSLSDALRKHIPYVPELGQEITLADLAGNVSGYRDFLDSMAFLGLSRFAPSTRQTAREVIATQDALNFPPRSQMAYCNTGFFLLSEIVEQIEGRPYNTVLRERITGPLGMNDTSLLTHDGTAMHRLAAHYTRVGEAWANLGWGFDLRGEGGMVSTLDDMIKWQRNLDAPVIGTRDMYERMAQPGAFLNGTTGCYGLGLIVETYHGRKAISHSGGVAGGRSESCRYVDDGLGIIVLANNDQTDAHALGRRIADLYFETPPSAPMAFKPGRYRERDGSHVFELIARNEALRYLDSGGESGLSAGHSVGTKPERGITDIVLEPSEEGSVLGTACGEARTYIPVPANVPSAEPLDGRFRNAGLDADVAITSVARNGTFHMRSAFGAYTAPLTAIDTDLWLLYPPDAVLRPGLPWSATLRVTRDGFELNSERTRGMRFVRL